MFPASDIFDDQKMGLLNDLSSVKSIRNCVARGTHIWAGFGIAGGVGEKLHKALTEATQKICLDIIDAEYKSLKKEYETLMEDTIND